MSEPIPPAPLGWNKTIDNLCDEMRCGERSSVGSPEADWAREYEHGLIPVGIRFPRKGDVYEALADMTVNFMTAWRAPFTGSGTGLLKKGDRVLVDGEPVDPKAIGVYAKAVKYEEVESRMVPDSERAAPKYAGFYFSFKTVDLNTIFRLVHED